MTLAQRCVGDNHPSHTEGVRRSLDATRCSVPKAPANVVTSASAGLDQPGRETYVVRRLDSPTTDSSTPHSANAPTAADHPQPGCGMLGGCADGAQPSDHHSERAREADERGDPAGDRKSCTLTAAGRAPAAARWRQM